MCTGKYQRNRYTFIARITSKLIKQLEKPGAQNKLLVFTYICLKIYAGEITLEIRIFKGKNQTTMLRKIYNRGKT